MKKGDRVVVTFEQADGRPRRFRGTFMESMDIGFVGVEYGLVKISKAGSVLVPMENINVSSSRTLSS